MYRKLLNIIIFLGLTEIYNLSVVTERDEFLQKINQNKKISVQLHGGLVLLYVLCEMRFHVGWCSNLTPENSRAESEEGEDFQLLWNVAGNVLNILLWKPTWNTAVCSLVGLTARNARLYGNCANSAEFLKACFLKGNCVVLRGGVFYWCDSEIVGAGTSLDRQEIDIEF